MFNFEDNIGLVVLKMIASKKTLFVKEVFKSDNMEQGYGTKCSILKITCSCMYSKQLSGKNLLLVNDFCKSDHLEQSYGTKHSILKIT